MPEPTDLTLTQPASLPGKTVAEHLADLEGVSPGILARACRDTLLRVQLRHLNARLPTKAHPSDACFDLYAPIGFSLAGHSQQAIDLGLALQLEPGWEAQIRGRSGLAVRGIHVHLGTIDHLYRGNVCALLANTLGREQTFQAGDRIAQMKLSRVWEVQIEHVYAVEPTTRGGLGSTGR